MRRRSSSTIESASKRVRELRQSAASLPDHERMRRFALAQDGLETSPGLRAIRRELKYVNEQLSRLEVQAQEA